MPAATKSEREYLELRGIIFLHRLWWSGRVLRVSILSSLYFLSLSSTACLKNDSLEKKRNEVTLNLATIHIILGQEFHRIQPLGDPVIYIYI